MEVAPMLTTQVQTAQGSDWMGFLDNIVSATTKIGAANIAVQTGNLNLERQKAELAATQQRTAALATQKTAEEARAANAMNQAALGNGATVSANTNTGLFLGVFGAVAAIGGIIYLARK